MEKDRHRQQLLQQAQPSPQSVEPQTNGTEEAPSLHPAEPQTNGSKETPSPEDPEPENGSVFCCPENEQTEADQAPAASQSQSHPLFIRSVVSPLVCYLFIQLSVSLPLSVLLHLSKSLSISPLICLS